MGKILGLDLGSNSIGWALIDNEDQKIIDMGVRIFPEGLNRDKGQEKSKNEGRRAARGIRRQTFRRKMRKKLLLDILYEQGMTPITREEIKLWWQGNDFPERDEIKSWLSLNPYELRAKGLDEKLSLIEFGRVLYHLIQRRGFKSNRLAGSTDEESTIFTGKDGVTGINETKEKSDDYRTLGQFLNTLTAETGQPYQQLERIRNRYTTRRMYIDEFEELWDEQRKYYPELFTHKLRTRLGGRKTENSPDDIKYDQDGVLFHQRPLRSQKFLVGKCTFEPTKARCPKSAIEYEEFRAWQQINNIRYRGEPLTDNERRNLFKIFTRKGKVTVSLIKKALGKPVNDPWVQLGEDDKNLSGCPVVAFLTSEEAFGDRWKAFSEKEKDKIWNLLYFAEDPEWLERRLLQEWDIEKDQAQRLARFRLPDGYGSLSRKAIRNILPFLEQGFSYDKAVLLGGVKNASSDRWAEIESEYFDTLENLMGQEKPATRIVHDIKDMLRDHAGFTEKQLSKLYHHSTTIEKQELLDRLPHGPNADREILSIRNPLVCQALFELRKVVNAIIEQYGQPDKVRIELARDLKQSKKQRDAVAKDQYKREKYNIEVRNRLKEEGIEPTGDAVIRYKLWEECQRKCPYTGDEISFSDLLSGRYEIEHIQPWSRSLNNSFNNLTLCRKDVNTEKGDKTPYEYFATRGESEWYYVRERVKTLFSVINKAKYELFTKKEIEDDFVSRQLNDTRYMSREASKYLAKICDKVQVFPGMLTSNLRGMWGLNNLLKDGVEFDEDSGKKERLDHRHHAIDALVVSCTNAGFLHELAKWNKFERRYDNKKFPLPWQGFVEDSREKIESILVSHKAIRKVYEKRTKKFKKNGKAYTGKGYAARGALHEETRFGRREQNGEFAYHVRKPLASLTGNKQIERIADDGIRNLVLEHLEKLGVDTSNKFSVPKNAFFDTDGDGNSAPLLFLPNKRGKPVPIKKVRMRYPYSNTVQLPSPNNWVEPGSNHHVLVYETTDGEWAEEVVTFWQAVERKKQNQPLYQLPHDGKRIIAKFEVNDMFLLGLNDEQTAIFENRNMIPPEHLYRVQKVSSMYYVFRLHTESSIKRDISGYFHRVQSFKAMQLLNPVAVRINSTGRHILM